MSKPNELDPTDEPEEETDGVVNPHTPVSIDARGLRHMDVHSEEAYSVKLPLACGQLELFLGGNQTGQMSFQEFAQLALNMAAAVNQMQASGKDESVR